MTIIQPKLSTLFIFQGEATTARRINKRVIQNTRRGGFFENKIKSLQREKSGETKL
jgi:hypothetical protein